jgi:hypothetical protein
MSTLLVLGSKPDPILPPASSFDGLACANASGFTAARQELPVPAFTVMTAVLTTTRSGAQSLSVLAGLGTKRLYFYPRPYGGGHLLKRAVRRIRDWRTTAFSLKWKLRSLAYRYEEFVDLPHQYYRDLMWELCEYDPTVLGQIKRKQPSTGAITLALGMGREPYERFILSGFSFELTHAYAENPEIDQRGTSHSRHAPTDIAVMNYLSRRYGNIFTTEPLVHEHAGIPLFSSTAA